MNIPLITPEIIESVRAQNTRQLDDPHSLYVLNEIQAENPHLHEAITVTIRTICEELKIDYTHEIGYNHMLMVLGLATAIYQCIQQQMIANTLND